MIPFAFRGHSFPLWTKADARHTVLYLADDSPPVESDPLLARLVDSSLNVLVPNGLQSRWLPKIHEPLDRERSAEQFLIMLCTDPMLPCPRPRAILGGEAALRIGFRHPAIFPVVACWDGDLDFHEAFGNGSVLDRFFSYREQARQQTAILQVRPGECPDAIGFGCPVDSIHARGHDRLHEKLNAVGVLHDTWTGDDCPIDSIVDFLVRGLEKRSRKLL